MVEKVTSWLEKEVSTKTFLFFMIPYVLMIYSGSAIAAWFLDYLQWVRISVQWVTMKPVTALCFFASSLAMLFHAYNHPRFRDHATGGINAVVLCVICAFSFNSEALNIFPAFEEADAPYTLVPDLPSWATIFMFAVFSLSFFMKRKTIPALVLIVLPGIILVGGYMVGSTLLTFYIPGYSTAVAFTTALVFLHQGLWLMPWRRVVYFIDRTSRLFYQMQKA